MNYKKVVLSHLANSTILSSNSRYFTQAEVDSGAMDNYIGQKANSRHECHVFDYSETFKLESRLSSSNPK